MIPAASRQAPGSKHMLPAFRAVLPCKVTVCLGRRRTLFLASTALRAHPRRAPSPASWQVASNCL